MTRLYWFKGAPGHYYLWDAPGLAPRRKLVGQAVHRTDFDAASSFYRCKMMIAPFNLNDRHRAQPKGAMELVEGWVLAQIPDAEFIRENF